ncbi:hypothetical protein EVAR_52355_1 [Eumeta japonica]|uniref:Uncharacterized protein n=1 Tax=Eumeta variegata TaxID=151549 RepID=A0A4C1YPA6_EUMVA|nr:hypothetical protein EVAR_52355_1 [Eumeta japonica]
MRHALTHRVPSNRVRVLDTVTGKVTSRVSDSLKRILRARSPIRDISVQAPLTEGLTEADRTKSPTSTTDRPSSFARPVLSVTATEHRPR